MRVRAKAGGLGKAYGSVSVRRTAEGWRSVNEAGFTVAGSTLPGAAGMTPIELLMAALAQCLAISLDHAAEHEGLALGAIGITVRGHKAADLPARVARFEALIDLAEVADAARRTRLIAAAERICTVSNTLRGVAEIIATDARGDG
ncbi:MAG: OsmC family peroxiredoxin [Alphaproteobacteria bacterium]|nr:OsmC family peroxiredoxin [Alphaproteobacteria bacterium]